MIGRSCTVKVLSKPPLFPRRTFIMEIYYTHMRGLTFFLEATGNSFEGRYEHKISGVGEQEHGACG